MHHKSTTTSTCCLLKGGGECVVLCCVVYINIGLADCSCGGARCHISDKVPPPRLYMYMYLWHRSKKYLKSCMSIIFWEVNSLTATRNVVVVVNSDGSSVVWLVWLNYNSWFHLSSCWRLKSCQFFSARVSFSKDTITSRASSECHKPLAWSNSINHPSSQPSFYIISTLLATLQYGNLALAWVQLVIILSIKTLLSWLKTFQTLLTLCNCESFDLIFVKYFHKSNLKDPKFYSTFWHVKLWIERVKDYDILRELRSMKFIWFKLKRNDI